MKGGGNIHFINKLLIVVIISIILYPSEVLAHPGGTDRHGGHKCRKDCADWHLNIGEYHLHDENGNPIRLGKKENDEIPQQPGPAGQRMPDVMTEIKKPETSAGVNAQIPQNAQQIKNNPVQQNDTLIALLNPLLLVMLIALFLLWFILNRRKKKRAE